MKKAMKIIILCIALISIFALTACGEAHAEHMGVFAIEEIQDDPESFLGGISLIGTVGSVNTQDFTLNSETADFEVTVDYRGSGAFPQVGDIVMVEGQLAENRPCCGPGFTLRSTQFQAVGQ